VVNKAYLTKRQKDALIQVWLDRRYIATGARWMQENNLNPRFMSDVFKFVFESALDNLVKSKDVQFVESTVDATQFLNQIFKNNLNPKGKGLGNLSKNLQIEQADGFEFKNTENSIESEKSRIEKEMLKHINKFKDKEGEE